ncbi:unnamed protein product [Commensalibacter communis]|nr:unnamed protein product [Commensalibacter communis]
MLYYRMNMSFYTLSIAAEYYRGANNFDGYLQFLIDQDFSFMTEKNDDE